MDENTPDKAEILETGDGSFTLYLSNLDETYHSRRGAMNESEYIFIRHGLAFLQADKINVLEIGWGTGLNSFMSFRFSVNQKVFINYTGLEKFPLSESLVFAYIDRFHLTEDDSKAWRNLITVPWGLPSQINGKFLFSKINNSLEDCELPADHFDVVFFDAFAPSKQPDIWQITNLKKCFDALRTGGRLVTYCAQGQFKRNLKSLGFEIANPPGPMGKKEMTIAIKP